MIRQVFILSLPNLIPLEMTVRWIVAAEGISAIIRAFLMVLHARWDWGSLRIFCPARRPPGGGPNFPLL
jgi:hypothetical protein